MGIVSAIIAAVAAPVGALLTAIFLRKKYDIELQSLKADINKKLAEVEHTELDNVRQGNKILMEEIVAPLKTELKMLRTDVNKFRRAIEKIPTCPHSVDCPVRYELQSDEKIAGNANGH